MFQQKCGTGIQFGLKKSEAGRFFNINLTILLSPHLSFFYLSFELVCSTPHPFLKNRRRYGVCEMLNIPYLYLRPSLTVTTYRPSISCPSRVMASPSTHAKPRPSKILYPGRFDKLIDWLLSFLPLFTSSNETFFVTMQV